MRRCRFGARTLAIPSGGLLLLLPVFVTWASDIGAFAVGRTIGRHKLIPSVSPGKTVEGAIGGLLASMLVAWAYTQFLLRPTAHLGFRFSPVGRSALRRDRERRGADRRPRGIAAQARGRREGQLDAASPDMAGFSIGSTACSS